MSGQQQVPKQYQRQSPAVYRRRRIMVGLGVLVVLAVVVGLIAWAATAIFGTDQDPDPAAAQPSASASVDPSEGADQSEQPTATETATETLQSDSGLPLCSAGQYVVEAGTDAQTYPAEQNPQLRMIVTHTGPEPCAINVGTTQQDFVVTPEGSTEPIFATSYCAVDPVDELMDFQPGQTELSTISWERVGSNAGCSEAVTAEPGTYQLTVHLGEVWSAPVTFVIE